MNKKARVKLLVSLGIALSLASLTLLSVRSKTYQILELKALDLRFALRGERPAPAPVVHIDIDDQSLAAMGRWPWPRNYHAKLTRILKECQAKQVLMDVLFTEEYKDAPHEDELFAEVMSQTRITYLPFYFIEGPDRFSPKLRELLLKDITLTPASASKSLGSSLALMKEQLPLAKKAILNEAIHDYLLKDPDMTAESLLQTMEDERGWFLFPEDENYVREHLEPQKASRFFFRKFSLAVPAQGWPFLEEPRAQAAPIMKYLQQIKGGGYINADPDMDGVTRRVALFLKHEDRILPQLTMAGLLDLLEIKGVETAPDRIILKQAKLNGKIKDISIPVDARGRMLVNWAGRWGASFKHIPYYAILRLQEIREQLPADLNTADPDSLAARNDATAIAYLRKNEAALVEKLTAMVKDKICIVGLTATGTHDLRAVPMQENYPMVGTHSNLINTILNEDFIVKLEGPARWAIFFLTALVIALSSLMKLSKSFLLTMGYGVGYFLAAFLLFVHFGLWIDLVGPFFIVVFGFTSITSYRFFTEEKEKLWIKQAFSHYLSKEVITELMEDPSRLKLGGERKNITVLFSDVRGFTAYSEKQQPEEVVAMLNEILSQQVKVVFQYNGTLDKFVGDELMAFFGAPGVRHLNDHALIAVRTAVEIQEKMRELHTQWGHENRPILNIGIGINTGDMVVGNMGSAERMDYTVIGDNVNLAARLCSAAGEGQIIISEATYAQVAEYVVAEKLEPIHVKGKTNPISIYLVTGLQ